VQLQYSKSIIIISMKSDHWCESVYHLVLVSGVSHKTGVILRHLNAGTQTCCNLNFKLCSRHERNVVRDAALKFLG